MSRIIRKIVVNVGCQRALARLSFLLFAFLATTSRLPAQTASSGTPSGSSPSVGQESDMRLGASTAGSITVRVFGPHNLPLNQQALIRLYSNGAANPLKTALTAKSSRAVFENPPTAQYIIEVISAGYHIARRALTYNESSRDIEIDFTLESDSPEDDDFTPSVTLPRKAQKQADKALAEFQSGNLKAAQKELSAAYERAPNNSDIAYLLGSVYLREKEPQKAVILLKKAVSLDAANVPALVALGQLNYEEGKFAEAAEILRKAVSLDSKEWLPLWLLSDIDFRAGNFESARDEAGRAVDLGKGAANAAEFIKAEALDQLGQKEEAVKALQAFLHDVPQDPNAPAARALAWHLEVEAPVASSPAITPWQPASSATPSLIQLPPPKLLFASWEPPGVDQEKLPVAEGVACPADQVVKEAGARVAEFVDSVNRIAATESVTYEELSTLGHPIDTERRKSDYLISISETRPGLLTVEENRSGTDALSHTLGRVMPFGLADLPLVFHPEMRSDFQMTCEGLGTWGGRATWLVYFRQRPDRPERLRSYELLDGSTFTVGLKGRAWIAADTYQIVRLEANLIKPIPQIGLGSEEDLIEYGPVPFRTKNTVLWLPTSADIYFYYQHRPFHRHHEFTKYQLFSVSASQKIGQPPTAPDKDDR